ncbi:MAG: glycoside hydrolase family 2 protein [Christensenellales bacterium]
MITKWGKRLDRDNVLMEYPRPQLRRNSYINLNGLWNYAIVRGKGVPDEPDGEILVPFSPESELSGVQRQVTPEDTLWYMRSFALPEGFNVGRVLLHFGAVDQIATVYLNGIELGSHIGGYTPFSMDITRELRENNQLIVKVKDYTDASYHSRGKQKIRKGGMWYTPQSGIWQTVWMESVPEEYISGLRITPLYDEEAVEITVYSDSERPCTARVGMVVAEGDTNRPMRISMQGFSPWTPDNPYLYDFSVLMGEDRVESYFGMRKFEMKKDEAGIMRLFLNDKPCFHNGVLDQGYWPEGLYTAPTDEAMIEDIRSMKELGFNMLRKHIKIEPLRWYYHCDRLGMLVWQDMINGGEKYDPLTVIAPLFTGAKIKDDRYSRFSRTNDEGREQFKKELDEMIANLYNCVSIAVWVPFNEGWGQFDAAEITGRIRSMDPTRLIDHASGWHDQGVGDIYSRHVYFRPYRFRADDRDRAAVLTECGGYSLRLTGSGEAAKEFGYKKLKSREELMAAYKKLYEQEIIPSIPKGLSGVVYTQLSDVEGETNGLYTYDREELKVDGNAVREINRRLTYATQGESES